MVLKFRAVFRSFLTASKMENLYLLTRIYLQNVVLYAKDWSTVSLMPDTEMVLHPSLFPCCAVRLKLVAGPNLTGIRGLHSSLTPLWSAHRSLSFAPSLTFPELCEYAVSLVEWILLRFALFPPKLWVPVCGGACAAVLSGSHCTVFYTKMTLTVANRNINSCWCK